MLIINNNHDFLILHVLDWFPDIFSLFLNFGEARTSPQNSIKLSCLIHELRMRMQMPSPAHIGTPRTFAGAPVWNC